MSACPIWRVHRLLLHAPAACAGVLMVLVCCSPAVLRYCMQVYVLSACLAFCGVAWRGVVKNSRTCPVRCWLRSAVVEHFEFQIGQSRDVFWRECCQHHSRCGNVRPLDSRWRHHSAVAGECGSNTKYRGRHRLCGFVWPLCKRVMHVTYNMANSLVCSLSIRSMGEHAQLANFMTC